MYTALLETHTNELFDGSVTANEVVLALIIIILVLGIVYLAQRIR